MFTLKDFLNKVADSYQQIVVEVFSKETNLIKQRYYIKPHSIDRKIPEDVMETPVEIIIPYINRISVGVMKGE